MGGLTQLDKIEGFIGEARSNIMQIAAQLSLFFYGNASFIWRARKKKRTPSGDGMGIACHVLGFRAKREKFFEALFGVTLHHLNLDPASSPEALMPGGRWRLS